MNLSSQNVKKQRKTMNIHVMIFGRQGVQKPIENNLAFMRFCRQGLQISIQTNEVHWFSVATAFKNQ